MNNSRKFRLFLPFVFALCVGCGVLLGGYLNRGHTALQIEGALRSMGAVDNKLIYTLSLIDARYVDSVSIDSIVEHLLPTLVKELDPHSDYIPASELQAVNEPLEGEFDGIGVVFNMAVDTVIVLNVIPKGPSDKAGIKAGDRIVEVDDSLIAGQKLNQNSVVKMLRGRRGTTVKLGVERQGIDDLVEIEVERGVIPIHSFESSFIIEDGIGYMKLGQFARTTHDEFVLALAELRAEGAEALILDLRGNSGGYLDQAIMLTNEFLGRGALIVYTEERGGKQQHQYATGGGVAQDIEVVVLIDEGSASSSEILAGALQDNDRAQIIGRRSFGKGLVQQQIPYSDGSALRLTVARYYTPSGRSIQKPYTIGDDESYADDMANRLRNNELFSADSIHFADSLKYTTVKGRTVYGGGGIMPDIFVPIDTADVTDYFVEVVGRNILYQYTIEYADKHRKALDALSTLDELQAMLDADTDLVDDFVRYAARKGVKPNYADIKRSRKIIKGQLRAYIARNTRLEDDGFYLNILPIDRVMQQGVKALK